MQVFRERALRLRPRRGRRGCGGCGRRDWRAVAPQAHALFIDDDFLLGSAFGGVTLALDAPAVLVDGNLRRLRVLLLRLDLEAALIDGDIDAAARRHARGARRDVP